LIIFKAPRKRLSDTLELTVDGCVIKPTNTVKLLCVTLARHMTFADHIDEVHSKCCALAGVPACSASYLTVDLCRLFYTSMIRTPMEYCFAVYTGASAIKLKKLDAIQKI
jgi:hypothetical protein